MARTGVPPFLTGRAYSGSAGSAPAAHPWGAPPWLTGRLLAPRASPVSTPPDLVAAVLTQLRSFNGGSVAAAFGDNATTANKFQSDKVFGSPAGPYARVTDVPGTREYSSDGTFIRRGILQVDVFGPGRTATRRLGWQVTSPSPACGAGALDGAALAFTEGVLMRLRAGEPYFAPTESVGPDGTPTLYHLVLPFEYMVWGQTST